MKPRNPIARVVRSIRMQIKENREEEKSDCVECAGNGVVPTADAYLTCGACNGTGVER